MEKSNKSSKGLFFTVEGGEGAGKTTLMERLKQALTIRKIPFIITREPGGTETGEKIRKILLSKKNGHLSVKAELFLFLADRSQHVEELILPALAQGKVVISDRFNDSTLAYQGGGRLIDQDSLKLFCSFATSGLSPDLTFFIDLEPKLGLARAKKGKPLDRIEKQEIEFHEKVRQSFLALATKEKERFVILDGKASPADIEERALKVIDQKLHALSCLL